MPVFGINTLIRAVADMHSFQNNHGHNTRGRGEDSQSHISFGHVAIWYASGVMGILEVNS